MSLTIDQSSFYNELFHPKKCVEDPPFISQFTQNKLRFHYEHKPCKNYLKYYDPEGRLCRKIIAIPTAIYALFFKTIYHIGKAILIDLPKIHTNPNAFKMDCYSFIRDFEEGFGKLMCIFHDRYGFYLIQRSRLHKQCYAYHAIPEHDKNAYFLKNGLNIPYVAINTSLKTFIGMSLPEQNRIIKKCLFQIQVETLERELNLSIQEILNQIDLHLLDHLTLADLAAPFEFSKLKFAVLKKKDFMSLSIKNLSKPDYDQTTFIKERLLLETSENQTALQPDLHLLRMFDIPKVQAINIQNHLQNMPPLAFALFSNEQIAGLKLRDLSANQVEALFTLESRQAIVDRLALFAAEDVAQAINEGKLTGEALELLTDEHIIRLKMPCLKIEQVLIIFQWKKDPTRDKRLFATYDPNDVKAAIEKGVFNGDYRMSLLSNTQRTKMTKDQNDNNDQKINF